MKRIAIILLSLVLASTSFAQGKLVKSSDKKAPAWIKKNVDKYEAVKVTHESKISLKDAEKGALAQLHDMVVEATVAYIYQHSVGKKDEASIKRHVENSSYVRNISKSTSLDTYWEVRYDKKSGRNIYIYYILYYFNDIEMKKIALEINQANSSTAIDF